MWFESLTGFREESPEQVRANIVVEDEAMTSKVNGREMLCGHLETSTLADLRTRVRNANPPSGALRLSEVVRDVQELHMHPDNAGALFQVASQFNLLEMVSPSVTPEYGVGIYENDRTQGPACAIACGAGTIFRNYFADVNGRIGQSAGNQIDCLRELGYALGNTNERLWTMRNGYALASYEATSCAAVLNSVRTGNNRVFLTLLGAGAFGNCEDWICSAIKRALHAFAETQLDVSIVSYGSSNSCVQELIREV